MIFYSTPLILIVETEIWPNFVRIAHQRNTPVMLVNGRFSDRSFPRYFRFRKFLGNLLKMFSSFCMQTDHDARRARRIGAPSDRIKVTGNLKFDLLVPDLEENSPDSIRTAFKVPSDLPVWVAGSTHAGEEESLARVSRRLQGEGLNHLLIMVPRHPERARSIGETLNGMGISWSLRSDIAGRRADLAAGEVLLVDSIGEMLQFYAIADLVFVGGSLVPVGGHNLLEASLLKRPVLFGSYMHNFKEITNLVLKAGGGIQVDGETELQHEVAGLLRDQERCREIGQRGFELLAEHTGATGKTLDEIARLWKAER